VVAYDGGVIHSAKPVKSSDDMKGMKLHPPTRLAGEALKALGAHPVAAPLSQVGDLLANRIVDGCIVPWDLAPVTRAAELTKFHAVFEGPAIATATVLLAMNKAKYDALPADLRTVLDNNSGRHFAGLAGAMFDERAATVEEAVKKRGHVVSQLPAREAEHWRRATEPAIHAWIRQMKERGRNGERLLAAAKSAVAKYASA
jgi:TRAP-type C4-dicarboxylate transport system substrate-binding protein